MEMKYSTIIIMLLLVFPAIGLLEAQAHPLFNSSEEWIGDHRVQISTQPEIPAVGEKIQVLLRVSDADFEELDRFLLGIRIFYHENQIGAIQPVVYENGHIEMDYVFEESGNHIFKVDLYDVAEDGGVLTYVFNISAQSPFGYIFIGAITCGGIMGGVIFGYIYFSKIRSKLRR
tara:strand:+ start:208 stop:729 length:522 start_codon:yes stop_codon:yes gene_type:complete